MHGSRYNASSFAYNFLIEFYGISKTRDFSKIQLSTTEFLNHIHNKRMKFIHHGMLVVFEITSGEGVHRDVHHDAHHDVHHGVDGGLA